MTERTKEPYPMLDLEDGPLRFIRTNEGTGLIVECKWCGVVVADTAPSEETDRHVVEKHPAFAKYAEAVRDYRVEWHKPHGQVGTPYKW